jgi:cell division protein FtsQ
MSRQRTLRITAWLAALTVIMMPLIAAMNGWLASDRWPFRQLSVHGAFQRVSIEEVRAQALPVLKPGYFAVDLNLVRERVSALPWIEHAEVRKRWPDHIEITINEREPIAAWGSDRLLSASGNLFSVPASTVPDGLPRFNGPPELRLAVRDFYREATTTLKPLGLTPIGVVLSDRGAWTMALSNGSELLLGREQAAQRLTRFAAVYQKLMDADTNRLQRADLRYENGFALRWAPLPPTTQATSPSMPATDALPTEPNPPMTPDVAANEPART